MQLKSPILISAIAFSCVGALAGAYLSTKIDLPVITPGVDTSPTATTPLPTSSPRTDAPLYITTMTHMEGDFKDDRDETLFKKHASDIRWAMELFDEYGAKLTIESERSFARASTIWGDNVLADVIAGGHGVGTHADFGAGIRATLTLDELTTAYKENKSLVDGLVGAQNNIGVSGGIGPTDWVRGATAAGFKFMTGVTGFAYLSMDESERPDGWTDTYIRNVTYHDGIPVLFADRLYPYLLADATDLVPDANGTIAVMSGELGELSSIAETRTVCFPDCVFDSADIDAVEAAIVEADTIRDRSQFAKLNTHIPVALLTRQNETLLREYLSMIKTYTDNGTLTWATQKEAYEAFMNWNAGE